MGVFDKIKDFISPEDESELELTEEEAAAVSAYEQPKNETASNISANANIVLFEPRNFEEAAEIAKHIKHKRACCVNLQRMPIDYRTRMVDFLNGVVYGVDGSIKKIADDVILCAPRNLQVAGKIEVSNKSE